MAQIEQADAPTSNAVATSFIRNVGANTPKTIENLQAIPAPFLNLTDGTYLLDVTATNNSITSSQRAIVASGSNSNADQDRIFTSGAFLSASSLGNSVGSSRLDLNPYNLNTPYKLCFARSTNKIWYVVNGALIGSATNAPPLVDLVNIALMGLVGSNVTYYGYLRRFTYWNKALTTDQMIKVTT